MKRILAVAIAIAVMVSGCRLITIPENRTGTAKRMLAILSFVAILLTDSFSRHRSFPFLT